jgi:hypothetical protein
MTPPSVEGATTVSALNAGTADFGAVGVRNCRMLLCDAFGTR